MIIVKNSWGTEIDWEAAVSLMDDELREQVCREFPDSNEEFFALYAAAHLDKYGEEWELDKANPCY